MKIKNSKKKFAKIILILVLTIFFMTHIGLLPYPKILVKLFFELNYEHFENTKEMMLSNDAKVVELYALGSNDSTIKGNMDSNVVMYICQYERIIKNTNNSIDFHLTSLLDTRQGWISGISYIESNKDSFNEYETSELGYHYEKIRDNWYICSKINSSQIPKP